ncbi:glycoside hydrolase family 13 protein [[Clostridium] symbiosum]|uniref:glycoside hydrolase family 13 protein n=1 Tax=Clostridium symbiosum TaxID=1512 RepID=UPI001D082C57|nr:glycoside hydrolase family 13 protein [[Clostridium] symbiosum]MCB6609626.1 glycoside hydrolase family 13 protein [[Clostridium] symbiosum]MCB6933132.1 glycoside hydrolase family 13 protein [[Clostridium] symbiosum]
MERINREALFCDETEDYRHPCEADAGQRVIFYFRTERDGADSVYFIEFDRQGRMKERDMGYSHSDSLFDYYSCDYILSEEVLRYCFRVDREDDICFYGRMGAAAEPDREASFCMTPGFFVPNWCKGAVMYQIYVDRFCNGDPSNDVETNEYIYIGKPVERVRDWNELPSTMDVRRFYGGDIKGIWDKLSYLKGLKVEAIYLNPIFVSPSNHKYDCQDYDHVDPHFGVIKRDMDLLVEPNALDNDNAGKYTARTADEENLLASDLFFARFVEAAHEKGIRVIIDGVFNHCGSFNKWLDAELIYQHEGGYPPGAYVSDKSPYRNFFKFNNAENWPFNDSYDGWWGHSTLPKLNYEESPELYQYIMEVGKKWVSPPFNADGWRLDVAADLGRTGEFNHQFWKDFRKAVKEANPEAVVLAEHYGDPSSWLQGDEWDTVMNYDAFMEPVSWFLTGLEKHSDEVNEALYGDGKAFFETMRYHMCRMQTPSLMTAMNELSNHDHSRFLTRTNRRTGRLATAGAAAASQGISYGIFRQGVVIQMTWPGAPTIYYGDEAGVCGWTDPDNRRTYPWGNEDLELIEFHRYMTGIRKRNPAFRTGSLIQLAADWGMIAYGRFNRGEDGRKESRGVVIINTCHEAKTYLVPVWPVGVTDSEQMERRMLTYEEGYNAGCVRYEVKKGILEIELPPVSSAVLVAAEL